MADLAPKDRKQLKQKINNRRSAMPGTFARRRGDGSGAFKGHREFRGQGGGPGPRLGRLGVGVDPLLVGLRATRAAAVTTGHQQV